MAKLRTRKWLLSAVASLTCLLAVGFYALAQAPDEGKRDRKVAVTGGTFHALPATLETTQWGWLDPKEPPKLVVNSGDTVAVETMMHAHNKVQPGTTMDEIIALRKANPGGGPHSLTGPIYVNGAEPGDVMEIRILKITPKAFGTNFNLPGKEFPTIGALASEMPDGFIKYFYLDLDKKQAEFKPGITIDLQPFPGTLAVGIDPKDPSPRKGGARIRWRRSRRCGRGRTAPTWTSTRYRPARPSSSRSSSRADSCGRATRTAARATARSTSPRSSARTARSSCSSSCART